MIYLFNVAKDDEFCSVITENFDPIHIRIVELLEFDDINFWLETNTNLFKVYKVSYHYYLGDDDSYSLLQLTVPKQNNAIYRQTKEDLNIKKLIDKLTKNYLDLTPDYEHLKTEILSNNVKIDALKLIAYFNTYWVEKRVESNGIFSYVEPKKEEPTQRYNPFGNTTLEDVLRLFD